MNYAHTPVDRHARTHREVDVDIQTQSSHRLNKNDSRRMHTNTTMHRGGLDEL